MRTSRRAAPGSAACTTSSASAGSRCSTHGKRSATTRRTSPLTDCSPMATPREPRHEIARVSELHVAQLLQPANVTPIKPQLGQQNLFIAQRAGPSHASFDEFASPVITNGLKLRASAVAGGNGSSGDDVSLAGLHDRVSYSVGHYRFATDGFRDNNDLEQEVANAFLQYRPSYETNLQAELRSARTEHGDLTMYFNRESYFAVAAAGRRRGFVTIRRQASVFVESHPARFVDRCRTSQQAPRAETFFLACGRGRLQRRRARHLSRRPNDRAKRFRIDSAGRNRAEHAARTRHGSARRHDRAQQPPARRLQLRHLESNRDAHADGRR